MAMKHKSQRDIIRELRDENIKLKSALNQTDANVEYIAMCTDVDLDTSTEEETDND